MWCVCQDNNPGTRNLELGHTVVKMKCAASRAVEDSDDAWLRGLRARLEDEGRQTERGGAKTGHGTGTDWRGKSTNKSACARMYVCDVGTYVRLRVWMGKKAGWMCILVVLRVAKETNTCSMPCVCPCHCTCNPGEFSCQLGWSASSGRISTGRPR